MSNSPITSKAAHSLLSLLLLPSFFFFGSPIVLCQKQPTAPAPVETITGHNAKAPNGAAVLRVPDGVKLGDGLSEDEAVAIALWNNVALHADLSLLGLARADLIEAGLLRNPLLSLVLPFGPYRQFESALSFPLEVFWQRRKRVEAAKLEVTRVAKGLEQNALNLIRDVRLAYADWLLAIARARLASDAVDVRRQIVQLTNVRLRVGDIGELEATATRLDESLAVEQMIRFNREVGINRDRVRSLLGISGQADTAQDRYLDLQPETQPSTADPSVVQVVLAAQTDPQNALAQMLRTAFESRPDLRAAALTIETAAKRAKWERSRIGTLAGILNIKQGEGVPFAPRPGLAFELPIFNRNQGGISRADAEVQRAAWHYLAVRQQIAAEVEESFNRYQQARETLSVWQKQSLPLAEESARLATTAYTRGNESYLFVLDGIRRVLEVRQREIDMESDMRRAAIQLDRSIGQQIARRLNAQP